MGWGVGRANQWEESAFRKELNMQGFINVFSRLARTGQLVLTGGKNLLEWNFVKPGRQNLLEWNFVKPGGQNLFEWNFVKPGRQNLFEWNFVKPGRQNLFEWNFVKPGGQNLFEWNFAKPGRKLTRYFGQTITKGVSVKQLIH